MHMLSSSVCLCHTHLLSFTCATIKVHLLYGKWMGRRWWPSSGRHGGVIYKVDTMGMWRL